MITQALRERLALRRTVKVRHVHQRRRLVLDRLGQVRMAMPEDVDRDPCGEVEISLALLAVEIDSLAANRADRRTRIDGHERRDGHEETAPFPAAIWCGRL